MALDIIAFNYKWVPAVDWRERLSVQLRDGDFLYVASTRTTGSSATMAA